MTNKEIIKLAVEQRKLTKKLEETKQWDKVKAYGVAWGGTRSEGKSYHAYCEFLSNEDFSHGYREGFFEDCIQTSREENAAEARRKGWVIGKGEFKDFAICPKCVEKLKGKK